jgi:hypothetical protein
MWADRYVAKLQLGETVKFRPRGHSMEPLIKDGELVTVVPSKAVPSEGAIVLCKVAGAQYLHLVTAIELTKVDPLSGSSTCRVQISNNKGHINGWTSIRDVYGVVTKVEP